MSGIFGLFNQDGAPVTPEELRQMAGLLERRGPDGAGAWHSGPLGLGHTLLASTPESLIEHLPLEHEASGCVITADVRLDNRTELLDTLGIPGRAASTGDASLILAAYLAWNTACVERLLGDFAFVIWDSRRQRLFCARDHFGLRPFYYHHSLRRFFAFASEPRAILTLPQTPYRINEGRIADALVPELEGIDDTCTFFEGIYRLPPAHTLIVTPEGLTLRRYWSLEPGPELELKSDEAYAEAFLDVFTNAVRCRLRGAGPVGSMLSGGMDSGAVVAVARQEAAAAARGPLPTVSAIAPDPSSCIETRTIMAALGMEGLAPATISHGHLGELMPELADLAWSVDEPFDTHMTMMRAIYLTARRQGLRVLLDGGCGDIVLSEGSHLARLVQAGRWGTAWREARGLVRFWNDAPEARKAVLLCVGAAIVPDPVLRLRRTLRGPGLYTRRVKESMIAPEFARRIRLSERLRLLYGPQPAGPLPPAGLERARAIRSPTNTAGEERYNRVASATAVEPRDPFLDRRVVALSLTLPAHQKLQGGWPKAVLRRAMAGRLPDPVRWRRGKEHLGWSFTLALMELTKQRLRVDMEENRGTISRYVDQDALTSACRAYFENGDTAEAEKVHEVAHLAAWLNRNAERPQSPVSAKLAVVKRRGVFV